MPKSSKRWLNEHFADPYVKKAKQSGYRSRSAYKLLELQERYRLFKPGMVVIDLGAAPGGWSQVLAKLLTPNGKVIALDLLPMEKIPGVQFIQGDFTDEEVLNLVLSSLKDVSVDWIISDMAPNISGNESIDIPKAIYLAELALDLATKVLNNKGGLLMKLFQGEGVDALIANCKRTFKSVAIRKPKASRSRSREIYLVAQELKPSSR